jgi:hypothetical protein
MNRNLKMTWFKKELADFYESHRKYNDHNEELAPEEKEVASSNVVMLISWAGCIAYILTTDDPGFYSKILLGVNIVHTLASILYWYFTHNIEYTTMPRYYEDLSPAVRENVFMAYVYYAMAVFSAPVVYIILICKTVWFIVINVTTFVFRYLPHLVIGRFFRESTSKEKKLSERYYELLNDRNSL